MTACPICSQPPEALCVHGNRLLDALDDSSAAPDATAGCPADAHQWGRWYLPIPHLTIVPPGIVVGDLPQGWAAVAQDWRRECATCHTVQAVTQ